MQDVIAPYVQATCDKLGKVYGEQKAVLVADTWYGWQDKGVRQFIKGQFPWLRMVYVAGRCTPVGQPMDAAIIAMLKGELRLMFG